jgi:hypothetical protein
MGGGGVGEGGSRRCAGRASGAGRGPGLEVRRSELSCRAGRAGQPGGPRGPAQRSDQRCGRLRWAVSWISAAGTINGTDGEGAAAAAGAKSPGVGRCLSESRRPLPPASGAQEFRRLTVPERGWAPFARGSAARQGHEIICFQRKRSKSTLDFPASATGVGALSNRRPTGRGSLNEGLPATVHRGSAKERCQHGFC